MTAHDDSVAEALRVLSERSSVMAALIEQHGPYTPRPSSEPDPFASLCRAIIFQQLAGRAASTIHGRFAALFDGPVRP